MKPGKITKGTKTVSIKNTQNTLFQIYLNETNLERAGHDKTRRIKNQDAEISARELDDEVRLSIKTERIKILSVF